MRYQNFLKIAALTIALVALEQNSPSKKNLVESITINQKNDVKSNNSLIKKDQSIVSQIEQKDTSIFTTTFKVVAFSALGVAGLGATLGIYCMYLLTMQGKMTGGMSRKNARKELADEFLDIFRTKKKYTPSFEQADIIDINEKPKKSNQSQINKPYRRTKF